LRCTRTKGSPCIGAFALLQQNEADDRNGGDNVNYDYDRFHLRAL
jgi:hypothetical protein